MAEPSLRQGGYFVEPVDLQVAGMNGTMRFDHGFVVATQTCDLERDRGNAQVVPLVVLSEEDARRYGNGRSPRFFQMTAELFADFDTVVTTPADDVRLLNTAALSLTSESDFRKALARRFGRAAVPGHVADSLKALRDWVVGKSGKDSPQGRLVDRVREIRVAIEPDWTETSAKTLVTVYLILPPHDLMDDELFDFEEGSEHASELADLEAHALKIVAEKPPKQALADLAEKIDRLEPATAEYSTLWLAVGQAVQSLIETGLDGSIREVTVEVRDTSSISLADVEDTDVLDLAFLSAE